MKARLKKTLYLIILLAVIAFSACGTVNDAASRVFPSIDNADLPDVLEKTVGNVGDISYTSFIPSHGEDYRAFLSVHFEDTTQADYDALMKHYGASSEGTEEDGVLLFAWGRLQVTQEQDFILVQANIK